MNDTHVPGGKAVTSLLRRLDRVAHAPACPSCGPECGGKLLDQDRIDALAADAARLILRLVARTPFSFPIGLASPADLQVIAMAPAYPRARPAYREAHGDPWRCPFTRETLSPQPTHFHFLPRDPDLDRESPRAG